MRSSSRFVRPIPALQIVLANCILCFGQGAFAESEPPVEGDPSLFELVRSAQTANIERLAQGTVAARRTVEYYDNTRIVYDASVTWKGDKAYWDYAIDDRELGHASDDPAYLARYEKIKHLHVPARRRLVFDGEVYSLLRVDTDKAFILSSTDGAGQILDFNEVDIRPATAWTRLISRPFVEMIGPHPNFPSDGIAKWVVGSDDSGIVRVERHGRDGAKTVMIMDLNLSGNLVTLSYKGAKQSAIATFDWHKDKEGRVLLRSFVRKRTTKDGTQQVKLDVLSVDLDTPVSDELFTLEALRIKPGTPVDDRVRGQRYNYKGREVTQQMLEEMIRKTKSQGFAAP